MIEVKDLGLEVLAQSKKEGLVLRFSETRDVMPFLRENAAQVRAITAEEPFVVMQNIKVENELAIKGRTLIYWDESTAVWHSDAMEGVALINDKKANKRGKSIWVPKGVIKASVDDILKMSAPDDIELFQREMGAKVQGFLNPSSRFFLQLEEHMAAEIRECDWFENDDSILIFDDRKGLHRGKYTKDPESKPLVSFYTNENY